MTMIRINLIAERKASAAPKAAKKAAASGSAAEIQENLVLIVLVLIGLGIFFFMYNSVSNANKKARAENAQLERKYQEVKKFEKEKEDFEIQKILLNKKIRKITELKDRREGPVKIMEDVANALPESAWLSSISQGYDRALVQASRKGGKAIKPGSSYAGEPALVLVSGLARTPDAVTNFADRLLSLDDRYFDTELNNYERIGGNDGDLAKQFTFEIFFKIRPRSQQAQDGGSQ